MPIVIPRTGALPSSVPVLTQEQADKLWEKIVRNWAQKHSESLKNLKEENNQ